MANFNVEGRAIAVSVVSAVVLLSAALWSLNRTAVVSGTNAIVSAEQVVSWADIRSFRAAPDSIDDAERSRMENTAVREFRSRVTLALAMVLGITASALVYLYCLAGAWRDKSMRTALLVLAVLALLVGIARYDPSPAAFFPAYLPLMEGAYEFGIGDWDSIFALPVAHFGNVLLLLATFAFTLTAWFYIAALRNVVPVNGKDELEAARRTFDRTNGEIVRLLYIASALLVVSVIGLHSYYSWPAALTAGSLATELGSLATTIAFAFGTGFTVWIVVIIGPAMWALNEKIDEVARVAVAGSGGVTDAAPSSAAPTDSVASAGSGGDVRLRIVAWREANGFVTTARERGFRLLATTAPILVGPVMDILTNTVA